MWSNFFSYTKIPDSCFNSYWVFLFNKLYMIRLGKLPKPFSNEVRFSNESKYVDNCYSFILEVYFLEIRGIIDSYTELIRSSYEF